MIKIYIIQLQLIIDVFFVFLRLQLFYMIDSQISWYLFGPTCKWNQSNIDDIKGLLFWPHCFGTNEVDNIGLQKSAYSINWLASTEIQMTSLKGVPASQRDG